jgi:hypothetical protein
MVKHAGISNHHAVFIMIDVLSKIFFIPWAGIFFGGKLQLS